MTVGFAVAFAFSVLVVAWLSWISPHGDYDGWDIWNMHARFLFRAGTHWRDSFSAFLYYSQPDYPLLVPGSIGRIWSYVGAETQAAPIAIAMLFTFATVGLLVSSISLIRSKSQGLLAGTVLLATTSFLRLGATQYADVPFSFYILATLVLLHFGGASSERDSRLLALSGVTAGLAAWTKNEGQVFFLVVLLAFFLLPTAFRSKQHPVRLIGPFLIGSGPILLLVVIFKTTLAPANDFLAGDGFMPTAKLLTLSRYTEIFRAIRDRMYSVGTPFDFVAAVVLILGFYCLLAGVHLKRQEHVAIGASLVVLLAMFGAYMLVYLTTPWPVKWHISTSLDRFVLQLWPSFLFTYFRIVCPPEPALAIAT